MRAVVVKLILYYQLLIYLLYFDYLNKVGML